MNFTNDPRGASRFTGIGAVALVHLAIIAGLAGGLIRNPTAEKSKPIPIPPAVDQPKPPEPIRQVTPTVDMVAPTVPQVPMPEVPVIFDQRTDTITVDHSERVIATEGLKIAKVETPQEPVKQPTVVEKVTAKMVCSKMGTPELPAVNWSGEALFRVIATVTGGRVTATEIQTLRGGFDAKTRRAFHSAIDGTMRDTYQCDGGARFEQEFQFRVD